MNKKILILGAGGFIGKSLSQLLNKDKYEIISLNRAQCDLCNLSQLEENIKEYAPDFIINAAIQGGRLLKEYTSNELYSNILMVENLIYLQDKYNFKLIHFGSAAKEDRNKDICNLKEGEFYSPPTNFYSLSKYFTAKRLLDNKNVILFNIFNIFGEFEVKDRFISTAIRSYLNFKEIQIWGDVYMDFFGINDTVKVIEYIINNPPNKYFELNLVYFKKYLMSEVIGIINKLDDYTVPVKILDNGVNKTYYGSGYKLADLGLKLNGLEKEIFLMYKELKK